MMKFQRELAQDVFEEMIPLLKKHWEEIAHFKDIPLNPDVELYYQMEDAGTLRVYTARTEEGKLVGYCVFFLRNNLHYRSSFQALQDVLFIDPDHRGMFGAKFILWCEGQLEYEGVQVVFQHIKVATQKTVELMKRLGYEPIDIILGKRLDKTEKS